MQPKHLTPIAAAGLALLSLPVLAGPFAPAAGVAGSTAVHKDSADFVRWATGYENYLPGANVDALWKTPEKALGQAVGDSFDIVALGDQGTITLTFGGYLTNGSGWDFAIFENSFNNTFLELAFVEVSSNGADFFRFPSVSLTPSPVGAFGSVDPTNIDGLAGKYRQGYGTPFDLDVMSGIAGLDINQVSHIRLVDIKGDGSEFSSPPPGFGSPKPIYDPYMTTGSGGFDLDAVGLRYYTAAAVPEPSTYAMLLASLGLIALRARRHVRG
ncbi:MAG: PEP-CTERM sorting domain-containing protein [Thiobacillus sp.]|nr:PEP-CTERM sorting domain-containing protein [Thiobacillus sp.]